VEGDPKNLRSQEGIRDKVREARYQNYPSGALISWKEGAVRDKGSRGA